MRAVVHSSLRLHNYGLTLSELVNRMLSWIILAVTLLLLLRKAVLNYQVYRVCAFALTLICSSEFAYSWIRNLVATMVANHPPGSKTPGLWESIVSTKYSQPMQITD